MGVVVFDFGVLGNCYDVRGRFGVRLIGSKGVWKIILIVEMVGVKLEGGIGFSRFVFYFVDFLKCQFQGVVGIQMLDFSKVKEFDRLM